MTYFLMVRQEKQLLVLWHSYPLDEWKDNNPPLNFRPNLKVDEPFLI